MEIIFRLITTNILRFRVSAAAGERKYQIHITEELHEVSYLDKVQLIAVDHPAAVDIYTNDKFKSPPYPEFRLFGDATKIHPARAVGDEGSDVTASVLKQDHTYPDAFPHNSAGVAELHTLELDFGNVAPENRAALVLNGWVDWADGSTFLGGRRMAKGLVFPSCKRRMGQANGRPWCRTWAFRRGSRRPLWWI